MGAALSRVSAQLDRAQMSQAFQDKFDREHLVRRRLALRRTQLEISGCVVTVSVRNVSRTAASYAALLPNEKFLLVYARNSARLKNLPSNIHTTSLDPDSATLTAGKPQALTQAWESLKARLIAGAPEYSAADATGLFDRIPGLMRWGIAVRDAWKRGV